MRFPPNYARRPWEADWPDEPPPAAEARCLHLGADVVGLRQCPTCRGNVRLKEFACAVGLGVGGRAVPSLDCGPRCPGYRPAPLAS